MKKLIYLINIVFLILACSEMKTKWIKSIDVAGPGNYRINDLHAFKNICVTGSYWETNQSPCCITAQYNEEGELEWYTPYKRDNIKASAGRSILEGNEGVYVLAQTLDIENVEKAVFIKYDAHGDLQWEKTVEESDIKISSEMFADNSGNIYIAGYESDPDDFVNIFVAKYRPSGELFWFTKYYNPSLRFLDVKFDVIKSNQFVVGGILKDNHDFFFLRYDSLGQFSGIAKYETVEKENVLADIKIDEDENVYMSGRSLSPETGNDYLTVAYDKDNNLLWAKRFDGLAHMDDIPKALAIDESSNVYVIGSSKNEKGNNEIVTIKYDKSGNELWVQIFTGRKDESAEPYFIHPDFLFYKRLESTYPFFVTGIVEDDVFVLKYNDKGILSWSTRYKREGSINRPTVFSGSCLAVESISEKGSEAIIVKYGPADFLGIARWD